MSEPVDSNLLARYLSDECSAKERAQVEDALAADPALQRRVGRKGIFYLRPLFSRAFVR